MNKEIVISGVNGFVGKHVAEHAKQLGFSVSGIGREDTPSPNVSRSLDTYQQCNLMDSVSTSQLNLSGAYAIIHLAGLASVTESFKKPDLYKEGNKEITKNLLSQALIQKVGGRVVVVSTGAIYDSDQPMPLSEESIISENSPYSIGKIKAETITKDFKAKGMDVVIARPFNHIGPNQGPGFLIPDLYEQLVKASADGKDEILVGNLTTKRDYTDVRDIAKAYMKLVSAESLSHDTYNICSGASMSGLEVLRILKESMGLVDIKATIDESKIRPTDAADIIGANSRIKEDAGWSPKSSAKQAIIDFVNSKD